MLISLKDVFSCFDKIDWVAFFSSKRYMKTRIETNLKDHLLEVSLDCSQTNIYSHPQYLREKENSRCCYITFRRQQGKLVQFSNIQRQHMHPLKGKKGLKTYHQLIIWTCSTGLSMEFRNRNDFHNSWHELQVIVSKYLRLLLPSSSLSTLVVNNALFESPLNSTFTAIVFGTKTMLF